MILGHRNSLTTFQCFLDIYLSVVCCNRFLIYLDDLIIFSSTMNEHVAHVDEVLYLLGTAVIKLKYIECSFFNKKVDKLVHVVLLGNLFISGKSTESITRVTFTTYKTKLKSFFVMFNFYRHFVSQLAKVARPLKSILKKLSELYWYESSEPQT